MWGITNPYQHKVIAAMEDYNRVLDATTVSENANGTAAEKMTIYTQTLEAAQNNLTSSIQQFAQDSNLDQILIAAYNGLAKVVEILNILLNKIPVLSPLIKAMGVALAAAFAAGTIEKIVKTSQILSGIVSIGPSIVKAFTSAGSAIEGFGAALYAAAGPAGVIFGILGAIIAIAPAVYSAWKKVFPSIEERADEAKQAWEDSKQELSETNSQITELNNQISDIKSKGTLTLSDQAELERLQTQLDILEAMRDNQEAINEQNKQEAISTQKESIANITGYDKNAIDEYKASLESLGNYMQTIQRGEQGDANALFAAYQNLTQQKKELNSTDEDYIEKSKTIDSSLQQITTDLLTQKQGYLEQMKTLAEWGMTNSSEYKKLQQLVYETDALLDPSNFLKVKLGDLIDTSNLKSKIQDAVQDTSEAGQQAAEGYARQFAIKILGDENMKQALADALNIDASKLNVDNVTQEVLSQFQDMYAGITTGYEEMVQDISGNTGVVDTYASMLDKINDKTSVLTKAYKELTKQGSLTADTTQKLIEKYPELADKLDFSTGKIKLQVEELKNLYNAEFESAEATVTSEIAKAEATIASASARIAAMQAVETALNSGELSGRDEAFYEREYRYQSKVADSVQAQLDAATEKVEGLKSVLALLQNTARTGLGSGIKDSTSGSSSADKDFENSIKNRMKYLQGIVKQYSLDEAWNDPATIQKYTDDFNNMLSSVLDSPEKRKIVADALNVDISGMSDEKAKEQLTKLLKDQYGDIQTEYQKLLKNKAKEDLNSAKTIINAYKEGVYGAWSSDEALNAAKADYDKFIKEITENEDYRKAVAESLNLGDITEKTVEEQIRIVVEAWQKSAGTLEDAQQDLYDEASKNIKALQDEIEDMIDTAIDLLEKAGDFLFDMLDKISDRYDAQIDNLDKISDELDDQKDAFEDKIDQQKELLKLQKEEMDNADELAEKNKSIADIDAQLMELQYDNSAEAQAKRLKLLDERAEKEKDLADWQNEYDYNTKIDALDKEKSEYEKTIEAEKKAIEAQKQTLQDAQSQFETTLSNIQNGFNTFIKILSSDLVKNLIGKALINSGSDTVTNLLIGYNRVFGSGIDTDVTGITTKGFKSLGDIGGKILGGLNLGDVSNKIGSSLNGIRNNFGNFANGISQIIQPGISNASGIFSGLGSTIKNAFNLNWSGIGTSMQGGLKTVSGIFSKMFSPIASGASSIGDAIGAGITGFFPGIFSALGTLVTTVGTAMGGVLESIATAMSAIPVVGWVIAGAAVVGAIALAASIAAIVAKTRSSKVSQPTQSFTAKKHHTGADYVKKENPALDKMLGLNDDETVSILHVGEAVVPTWANNATSSASSNRFTGSPFGSAVDTAVKSARTNSRTYSSSDNSTINISMPINIQGDADSSTVNSLRKEADNIVNRVLKTINSQTRIGGYRNIKAATV